MQRIQLIKYLVADLLSMILSLIICGFDVYVGITLCVFWFVVYWISGYYNENVRRSRLTEFFTTLISVFVGVVCIAIVSKTFTIISLSYHQCLYYFGLQFLLTYFCRLFVTQSFILGLKSGRYSFPTLVIGVGENAKKLPNNIGTKVIGYISVKEKTEVKIDEKKILGEYSNLLEIVKNNKVEEVVVAIDNFDSKLVYEVLRQMYLLGVDVKITENLRKSLQINMLSDSILGFPLVNLSHNKMPYWQQNIKRLFDVIASVLILISTIPITIYISLRIKCTDKGSVFYRQERIGRYGKKFDIIKFRSMRVDAENGEPLLSSENDDRITKIGKTLRRFRLDEIPQFYNVICGEMSIVGFRPERAYYVDKISEKAPEYYLLLRILPGITSWGMAKYGYATSVEKMIERLHYDIIYIENNSLLIDLKILIHTVIIVLRGREIVKKQ